eukprot:48952_1
MHSLYILISAIFLQIPLSSLSPTVHWYTNTNLANNKRTYEAAPSAFSGFYFCCGQYKFTSDGTFVFNNSTNLIENINYWRKITNIKTIYIHGGFSDESIFNVPSNYLQKQFENAAKVAKEINIDGFLVDYEPHSDDKSLAKKYGQFLKEFQAVLGKQNIGLAECGGGWGILKYFDEYSQSNLNMYTSMEPTYNGSKYPEPITGFVINETQTFKKNQIRSGIGSMLVKYPPSHTWHFDWTQKKLTNFLNWLKYNISVPSVDIWRADLDNNGYDTEPWFYQCLENFMKD